MNVDLHLTLVSLVVLGICITSCTDDNSDLVGSGRAVISGYLFAGNAIDSLRIVEVNAYQGDGAAKALDDLEITISSSTGSVVLTSLGQGYYEHQEVTIEAGKEYTMAFDWNGEKVFAETYVPQVNQVTLSESLIYREKVLGGFGGGFSTENVDLEVTWENSAGEYYFILVENMEENPEYINSIIEERLASGETIARPLIRTEPEITDFHFISNRRDIQQFGTHRVVVFRLNPEYAALYASSGTSSLSIAAPPTNVENGLGIFTGISSDTVYFEVVKE